MLVHFQVPNEEWDALNKYKVNVRCKGISFLVDISFLVWAHDHLIKIINFHFLIPSIKLPIPRSALKVHEHLSTIIKLSIPRFSNKIANSSHGPESAPAVHKSRNRCSKFPSSLIPQQNKATRIVMIICTYLPFLWTKKDLHIKVWYKVIMVTVLTLIMRGGSKYTPWKSKWLFL